MIFLSALPIMAESAQPTAQTEPEVGITPQLGKTVPLQATFVDEKGDAILLGGLLDRPTILALVFYECPNICGPMLSSVGELIDAMSLKAGVDYKVVATAAELP